jgi:uncharacterized membrane protein
MSLALLLPIVLIILSSVTYHVSLKFAPQQTNPALVVFVAYLVALLGSTLLFVLYPLKQSLQQEIQHLNWANGLFGLAIVGIELGFLLAYRAGWNVNVAPLIANLMVALLLIPVGLLLFKEHLTPVNIVGVVLCVVGLVLVNVKTPL